MLYGLLPSEVHAELSTETMNPLCQKDAERDGMARIEDSARRIEAVALELRGAATDLLPRQLDALLAARSRDQTRQLQECVEASLEAFLRRAFGEFGELDGLDPEAEKAGVVYPVCGPVHQCASRALRQQWSTRHRRRERRIPLAEQTPRVAQPSSTPLAEQTGKQDQTRAQPSGKLAHWQADIVGASPPQEGGKATDADSVGTGCSLNSEHFEPPKNVWDELPKNAIFTELRRAVQFVSSIEEPHRKGSIARVVHSTQFEIVCTLVIIFNAFFAAYTADYEIKHIGGQATTTITMIEWSLLAFYVFELALRFWVHRLYLLCNSSWHWNAFDLFLVIQSLYGQMLALTMHSSGSGATFMRIFRLLKLSKIVRVFKVVRVFRELRMMLTAVRHSVGALFWAIVMLMFFLYVFALIFVQGFTAYLADNRDTLPQEELDEVMLHFGSVMTTVVSMYKAGLGGDDWSTYHNIAERIHWSYGALFLFYIAFFSFTVTNILTGMIVENVVSMSARDEENVLLEFRRSQSVALVAAERLFAHIDDDASGDITLEEFLAHSKSDAIQALMSNIGLDVRDAELFFRMLHGCSHEGKVNSKEFIEGCLKIRGNASAIDVQCLSSEVHVIRQMLADLKVHVLDRGA